MQSPAHAIFLAELSAFESRVEAMDESVEKQQLTPVWDTNCSSWGTLTEKVPQFHLLDAGNPKPESVLISPLYQITIDEDLKREVATV
jgi:hypothetical protein